MRTLLLSVLLLAGCSEGAPPPAPPAPAQPAMAPAAAASLEPVLSAERAFAAEAVARGWVEAYERWADAEGIVLQNGPESAKDFAANIHPDVRGDTSLRWAPAFAGISAAGDFGFTAGPFNGDDSAFGHYLTVWRKTGAGDWRFLFEGGIDVRTPTQPDAITSVMAASAPETADGAGAAASVEAAEAALAQAAAVDARAALADRMAPSARVQRMAIEPASDAAAIAAALAGGPAKADFRNLRTMTSPGGDMAFTVGEARWDGGGGYYTRVWTRLADGWRIMFDQLAFDALPPI
jgi:hypothetical protein